MLNKTPIDRLYEESLQAIRVLQTNEPSLSIAAADNFRKTLLLAAASYFESQIIKIVDEYIDEESKKSSKIKSLIKIKVLDRQYHTLFDWKKASASPFWAMFGPEYKKTIEKKIASCNKLSSAIRAFLEIGNERNKLVHQDFATFPLLKTLEEIYSLYVEASNFISQLNTILRIEPTNTK